MEDNQSYNSYEENDNPATYLKERDISDDVYGIQAA